MLSYLSTAAGDDKASANLAVIIRDSLEICHCRCRHEFLLQFFELLDTGSFEINLNRITGISKPCDGSLAVGKKLLATDKEDRDEIIAVDGVTSECSKLLAHAVCCIAGRLFIENLLVKHLHGGIEALILPGKHCIIDRDVHKIDKKRYDSDTGSHAPLS